ncbi:trimethylguanosine synthase, putative [Coccidioides posadasii C735 delta SOWgp]|uniref:Trimethylguanosine synthase n=1 Tax=Coccidioides posadasii (strain C735) TaxID=222929 RepID=C5PHA8_COCP7|nr:trimethylguanosine synthase, putative [Coccidioides posadasii C735 delta SOWgp]EER23911.1 trimethylguanosine synthase, putative [Coccidioides posadasii C735 delta SOWgp]|eukprot:XP_003066056.1 trimethylguanosine synthase, putative [Coccidioides posadasii C735 delta SOWgp]
MAVEDEAPPPEVKHYNKYGEVPWDIQNYWAQRYNIFSRYDDGVWLTDDAWFGVTPEPIANKIAAYMTAAAPQKKSIVIDTFAGVGGNAIAFARSNKWRRVYAIEKDPASLQCAKHNAKIYGVEDKITWFQGDCFEILKTQLKDLAPYSVIFASPPWGGPGYRSDKVFNLSTMEPYSIETIYSEFSAFTTDIALFLPRSSDLRQLAALVKDERKVTAMHYCMDGASKALCIYYGDFKIEQE